MQVLFALFGCSLACLLNKSRPPPPFPMCIKSFPSLFFFLSFYLSQYLSLSLSISRSLSPSPLSSFLPLVLSPLPLSLTTASLFSLSILSLRLLPHFLFLSPSPNLSPQSSLFLSPLSNPEVIVRS